MIARDAENLGTLLWYLLGGAAPQLSRWERLLVYFGLRRDPRRPYVHTFTPAAEPSREPWFTVYGL